MSIAPTSPVPVRCERVSSTTTRAGATGALLEAAAEEALDGGDDGGAVEAEAAALDVPAVGVVDGATDDATGADDDVLACVELEVHAVAKVASATRTAARMRDDVSTALLKDVRSTTRRLGSPLGCARPTKH